MHLHNAQMVSIQQLGAAICYATCTHSCTACTDSLAHTSTLCKLSQQELNDIVFDQTYAVSGEEMPVKLPFSNTIFVMEDIDAASPIVQSRDRKKEKSG
jgi:hypothetical protein